MKINSEHIEAMRALIAPLDTTEVRAAYLAGEFPRSEFVKDLNRRYRFDLLYASKAMTVLGDLVNDGLTDAHLDTALRRIVPVLAPTDTPSTTAQEGALT